MAIRDTTVEKPTSKNTYQLTHRLGAGATAEAYLASYQCEAGFQRRVVVRQLLAHLQEVPASVESFTLEARLMSHIAHPNLVQIYDFGRSPQSVFMAVEYVRGVNLLHLLQESAASNTPIALEVLANCFLQLAYALDHLHNIENDEGRPLKIVHRDISPKNVYVQKDGWVKLIDFGAATSVLHDAAQKGDLKGTVGYAAPEQVKGKAVDARADIFSWGVLFYELVTAKRLFGGDHLSSIDTMLKGNVTPPQVWRDDLPDDLEALILSALEKDPNRRIGSARELITTLETFAKENQWRLGASVLSDYIGPRLPPDPRKSKGGAVQGGVFGVDRKTLDHMVDGFVRLKPPPAQGKLAPLKPLPVFGAFDALSADLGEHLQGPKPAARASQRASGHPKDNTNVNDHDIDHALSSAFPNSMAPTKKNDIPGDDPEVIVSEANDDIDVDEQSWDELEDQ